MARAAARLEQRDTHRAQKTPRTAAGFADRRNLGLPADLLIAADGRVVAAKYGSHAYDQWSVDELLALAGHTTEEAQS